MSLVGVSPGRRPAAMLSGREGSVETEIRSMERVWSRLSGALGGTRQQLAREMDSLFAAVADALGDFS